LQNSSYAPWNFSSHFSLCPCLPQFAAFPAFHGSHLVPDLSSVSLPSNPSPPPSTHGLCCSSSPVLPFSSQARSSTVPQSHGLFPTRQDPLPPALLCETSLPSDVRKNLVSPSPVPQVRMALELDSSLPHHRVAMPSPPNPLLPSFTALIGTFLYSSERIPVFVLDPHVNFFCSR